MEIRFVFNLQNVNKETARSLQVTTDNHELNGLLRITNLARTDGKWKLLLDVYSYDSAV